MHYRFKVLEYKPANNETYLKIKAEGQASELITRYNNDGVYGELNIDDGRRITSDQRKKIYASIKDIAEYIGDIPEYTKELFKFNFCGETGQEYFSLSDCSVTTAREFINYIIEFVIRNGIPLQDIGINRTDDIDKYLYYCIKFKRCCICGKDGELHHVDTIGAGNNRNKVDDSNHRKMCLCRTHHTLYHTIGETEFTECYKVYGIIYRE